MRPHKNLPIHKCTLPSPFLTNIPESLLRLEAMVVMRPEFWKRVRSAEGSAGGAWDCGERGTKTGLSRGDSSEPPSALESKLPPLAACCSSGGMMSPGNKRKGLGKAFGVSFYSHHNSHFIQAVLIL